MREKEGVAGYIGCNNGQRENERECVREKEGVEGYIGCNNGQRENERECVRERDSLGLHWIQ